jgi:serine phosphatase RsbU (regulator of sigma subunit)
VRRLDLDTQPPLGAEEDHPYSAQTVRLRPGDRLVLASDGLSGARIGRQLFGDRLERVVQSYRLLGTAELVRAVIRDLIAFHGGELLADDAVVLCLDVPAATPP